MRICENGIYRDMTAEELASAQAEQESAEAAYWQSTPYDEAVNAEIRKRYTESQEFAILRQQAEKPEEYAEYYAYCEQCKKYVRAKKMTASEGVNV